MIENLMNFAISIIETFGYAGIFGAMLAQGVGIPIPSEATMLFGGFLAAKDNFNLELVIFFGVLGDSLGAVFVYWLFRARGREILEKYGKYLLIHTEDIKSAERWFLKYGGATIFFGKMLPVVRGVIIYPAAISKMEFKKYLIYDICGAFVWCASLAIAGVKLEKDWDLIIFYLEKFKILIFLFLAVMIFWYIRRHLLRKHA